MQTRHTHPAHVLLSGLLLAALPAIAPAQQTSCAEGAGGYTQVPLTGLGPGFFAAAALNDASQVAGSLASLPGNTARIFMWQAGVVKTHEFSNSVATVADIDQHGVVVGGVRPVISNDTQLFVWDTRTDVVTLLPLPFVPSPSAINEAGVVVGVDQDGLFGFTYDTATQDLEIVAFGAVPPVGVGTQGTRDINRFGIAVGSEFVLDPTGSFYLELPYRWSASAGVEPLAVVPGGYGGAAVAVSNKGHAAGFVLDEFFVRSSALWTDGGRTVLNLGSPPNFFESDALDLNFHDQVIVVAPNDLFGFTRGFVWDDGAFSDLSCFTTPGLFVTRPVAINNVGEILAQLTDAAGLQIVDTVLLRPDVPFLAAGELVQAGSPENPKALRPGQTFGPVLGQVWDPVIDHQTFFPSADLDFLWLSTTSLNLPLPPLGTLLCGTALLSLFEVPGTPFQLFIPDDPTLGGAQLCAGGGALDVSGAVLLTNSLELTLGAF